MAYWYWTAYDQQTEAYNGVCEETRYEMVVLKLAQKGLTASLVQKLEYGEYRRLLGIQRRLETFSNFKKRLHPNGIPAVDLNPSPSQSRKWIWSVVLALLLVVHATLLVCYYWLR